MTVQATTGQEPINVRSRLQNGGHIFTLDNWGAGEQLTIDSIYSKLSAMNIALTKHFEELIERLVTSGRYNNSSEVVRAGLRILDAEERALSPASFPPGSLRHLYTKADNRAERCTAKGSTLKVEAE